MSQYQTIAGLQRTFLENGEIHVLGNIDEATADYVHESLLHLKAHGSPDIKVFFRSHGGILQSGFHLYDEFQHYAGNTRGIATAFLHSSAAIAIQGCTERLAYPHATVLVHEGGYFSEITRKDLSKKGVLELRKGLGTGIRQMQRILELHTDLTLKEIRDLMARDQILTAPEALKLGLLDDLC